jgi:tetratricopeptide (TPR) repeat protein
MRFTARLCRDRMIATLLLVVLAFAGCMRSPEAKSAAYIEAGKRLLEKKDPARAILQFRNATQTTPKNAEAYYHLGKAFLAAGDLRGGVVNLHKALELNPKHAAARLWLAQLMTGADDPRVLKDAQQRLEALLRDAPENADAMHALALTELKLGEPEDAVQHLERAMAVAPQDLVFANTLAAVKLQQGDSKGAEEILRKACEDSPKSGDALVLLGRLYAGENRLADAERQFQQALAIDPNSVAGLLNLATLQSSMGRKQDAEANFKRLASLPSKDYKYVHAAFLFQEGRRDEATREFEVLAKQDPENRLARTRLVAAYQAAKRLPDAQKVLNDALKKNPKDMEALLQRGELFLGARKYSEAEADLNQVLHLKADSPEVHYAFAKLHQARGEAQIARQEFNETLRLNPFLLPVRLELAKSLIAEKAGTAALSVLDGAPEAQKREISVTEQRNWALLSAGQAAEARKGVEQALPRARTSDLLLQDAILKITEKRYAEARHSLHEALGKRPEDARLLRALVGSYAAQNQVPSAVEEVRAFALQHPNSAAIQYFWGNLLIETGDRTKAKQALAAAKALDPEFAPADLSLARIDLLQANWKDARQELTTILSAKGENPLARQWLGMLEATVGDQAAATADFRRVVESQPNNAIALNNLAFLLAENGKADEALKYAEKAVELAPGRPEFEDTLGWILYRKGLYEAAVTHLQSAVSKGGDTRQQYHLATAYFRKGDQVRGQAILTAALRKDPTLPEAQLAQQAAREATQKR